MSIIDTFPQGRRPESLLDEAEKTILKVLEQDWRRMCGLDRASTAMALNPAELDAALPHAFVLHRVGHGTARVRVAGQKLHDLMRMDPRGMPFASFFSEASRETAQQVLDHAFDKPAIIGLTLTASRGLGRKPVRAELLLLPMRDAEGKLTRMMGAIVTSGPLPNRPLRFDVAAGMPLRVDGLAPGLVERRARRGQAAPQAQAPARGTAVLAPLPEIRKPLGEAATRDMAAPRPVPSQRPRLRLVVDNTV